MRIGPRTTSFALASMIVFSLILTPARAEFLTPEFDSSIFQDTGLSRSVEKVIFSRVERKQILDISDEKYVQEVAYFFSKLGFPRPPVSYILFDNGNYASVNTDWYVNHFSTSYESGVIFVLLVHDGNFALERFEPAFAEFKKTALQDAVALTSINSVDDIELRDFIVDNTDEGPKISFQYEDLDFQEKLREKFISIDYQNKKTPSVAFEKAELPQTSGQGETVNLTVAVKNTSDFDFFLTDTNSLKFYFDSDSAFFANDKWLNRRTPLVVTEGIIKAGETKEFQVPMTVSWLPGDMSDTIKLDFRGVAAGSKPIQTRVNDSGYKILQVKPTELNFLFIRKEPYASSEEIGRASVGYQYVYTENQNGYYKIIFNGDQTGWVSARYVDILK